MTLITNTGKYDLTSIIHLFRYLSVCDTQIILWENYVFFSPLRIFGTDLKRLMTRLPFFYPWGLLQTPDLPSFPLNLRPNQIIPYCTILLVLVWWLITDSVGSLHYLSVECLSGSNMWKNKPWPWYLDWIYDWNIRFTEGFMIAVLSFRCSSIEHSVNF